MRLYTRIIRAVCWLSGTATVIVGCNSGDGSVDQGEFQSQIIHALCDSVQQCCTTAERGFDPDNCRQRVITQFIGPLSDTTLIYDRAQAGRCIQAVSNAAQACNSVDVTTCFDAFIGNLPPGAQCSSSFECASGPDGFAVCDQNNICAQPVRGVAGQPCSFTCIENGGMPRCHNILYGGGASADQAACHSNNGLACVLPASGPATCQNAAVDCKQNPTSACPPPMLCNVDLGQCYTPVPVGGSCAAAPCGSDGWCAQGICYPVKPNAATCATDVECQSGKCEKTFCVQYSKAAADWCGNSTNE
jgi:hypothetical protein